MEKNVNFFADIFVFITNNLGELDGLNFDNPLSIIQKSIYQIEENTEYSTEYLKPLLSHNLLYNNKELVPFKNYESVQNEIDIINGFDKKEHKKWSLNNQQFLIKIKKLERELRLNIFKNSLGKIIELLKVTDGFLDKKNSLIYHSSIIATELLFKGYHKKDLENIFNTHIIKPTENGFNGQFLRFEELYNAKPENDYFIFQIDGISLSSNDILKYDVVSFYSGLHRKFEPLRKSAKDTYLVKNFFQTESAVALVKVKYNSKIIGQSKAVREISKALLFLNNQLKIQATIKPFAYFHTPNFKISPGHRWERAGENYRLNKFEFERLEKNVFIKLKTSNPSFRKHFLKNEFLYEYAISTGKSSDIWLYLETLLHNFVKESNHRIDLILTNILLSSASKDNIEVLELYLINAINNDHNQKVRIDRKQYYSYFDYMNKDMQIPIGEIESSTDHWFVHFLTTTIRNQRKEFDKEYVMNYFLRVISDLKSQRNSYVHSGFHQTKTSIALALIMPDLLIRFRRNLINKSMERNDLDFNQVISLFFEETIN